ncbi:LacI family DNA-binding transcriptional regulator [Sphingomonas sp. Leaf25]|uniref:LacI family DNA-binding transcriptional regulator n=1 Tax=Sphingomonas sp. Leaf25 TaxID=1735692 RepID=UPI0006FC4EC9|nr:LacI family DNA-binding transcriptional regulator [Sphingomonas sp. Leaf25]KQN06858.1 LacI family transcriptional regulator [Sphingomonas sp. Leaf25]
MDKPSRRSRGSVTVQDVARAAGVSAMTVSRVVNGGVNVRESTREAVNEAIERLNYWPNSAARSLAAGDATQIGLLYANPSLAYLSNFLIGALEGARKVGCHLVLEPCEGESAEAQAEATRRFASTAVQGVILPPPLSDSAPVQAELDAAGIPSVAVAIGVAQPGRLAVRIDDFAAAKAMTRHLLDQGHRRIGFIRGNPNNGASGERWRGFVAAIEAAGLDLADMPVEQGYFTFRSGMVAGERLIDRPDRPQAIFASNDDMAAAVISVAHRRGLHVPDDLSIVGFDDTSLATTTWPEITTVRQPIAAMAEAAVELLLARIRDQRAGQSRVAEERILDHELIVRESAGPAPVPQADVVPPKRRVVAKRIAAAR